MTTGLVEEYEVLDRNIADGKVITHTHRDVRLWEDVRRHTGK